MFGIAASGIALLAMTLAPKAGKEGLRIFATVAEHATGVCFRALCGEVYCQAPTKNETVRWRSRAKKKAQRHAIGS